MRLNRTFYNDSQMTDSNSLARALLTAPAQLAPVLTHLGGMESKRFPLSVLTEGVKNTRSIDQMEYEYKVKTKTRKSRELALDATGGGSVGLGHAPFQLTFPDKWFIKDYVLVSQSGVQARIMEQPQPSGSNYVYTVRLVSPDPTAIMPASDLVAGAKFASLFAPVGTDHSRGNASNWVVPTKLGHKMTTIRKSYLMSGNAVNAVMEVELPIDGKLTKLWMDYEEWQHMQAWREEVESLWVYGEQSYNDKGETALLDENGQPIIISPGILQQVINKDTYSILTAGKLKDVFRSLFFGMTDAQNKSITILTGLGGLEEFDRAMKEEMVAKNYTATADGKFISGTGRNLVLGGFFTTYEHIDGHTIRVVHAPLFDDGAKAESSGTHPRTNLPLESYRMLVLDHSSYDGESNLIMVNKKGREFIRWAVSGSTIPKGFTGNDLRATDIDGAGVHFLKHGGILLRRFDTSLDLQCVA